MKLFILLTATAVSATSFASLPGPATVEQTCEQGYSIINKMGELKVRRSDGRAQPIVRDSDRQAHSNSFTIVWEANPNGLGGAVLFPNNGGQEVNCDLPSSLVK